MENQLNCEHIPAISVIMSVKNGADTLDVSIKSILSQTFTDWEFIICDDGSNDDTYKKLQQYAEKDSRIIILQNEKSMGLAFSLNKCIEVARSEILARQDADDRSDIYRFEKQYSYVLSHSEFAIVGTCWFNVSSDGSISESMVPEYPTAMDMKKGGLYMHPSWMMRKSMLEKVGYYTVNRYTMRSQDYHLVMKVFGEGMRMCNMQEKLYYYTADENTMNRSRNWKRVFGLMWIRWDSYRRNKFPIMTYIYVLKPLLVNLIPGFIMKKHYKKVYSSKGRK